MNKKLLAMLIPLAFSAQAQTTTQLKEVTVTATRVATDIDAVPATVTTLDRETLDRRLPRDAADLFRDEPDVAFARDARRFGATRPNIRGLQDNRVLQLVDGVRMPDFYNGGGPTNFTMSAPLGVPIDFLKRVEILRGPASSIYGSDAMGGVVGYLTLDPADLLKSGANLALQPKLAYTGANEGFTGSVLGAGRADNGLEWLLGYSHTQANEVSNMGRVDTTAPGRTAPNPQDVTDRGFIAKLAFKPAPGHAVKLTLEGREQDADVVVKRLAASLPRVTAMHGDDHSQRQRGTLEWQHQPSGGLYDRLTARVYRQNTDTENFNYQTRSNTSATCSAAFGAGNNCRVEQDFFFEQTLTGGGVQVEKGWGIHHLIAGLELSRTETEQRRDARVWNLTTGTFTKSLAGDTFPLRDFAPGYTDSVGLYAQDEIALLDGRLSLTPGLRYDWRKLQPEPDALSLAVLAANNNQAAKQTDGAFSPKLAALWRVTPQWAAFGHIAGGFRAPNYDEVNGHFRNTAQSYGVRPNPDLTPETSVGVELGLRLTRPGLRGQVTAYDNRYQDFIGTVRLNCPAAPNPARDPRCIAGLANTNMSQNLSKVRIYGAEARAAWDFQPGWNLAGALAWAHGQDQENDVPLNTIEPARLSLSLARDAGAWGGEARLRAAKAVTRTDDRVAAGGAWFRPDGYGVLDLSAWYKPSKNTRLTVAANNLTDKKYFLWSDIRQADAKNPVGVDFYSQPGRNVSVSLQAEF